MKLLLTLLAELWRSTRGLLAAALVTLSGLLPQITPALPAPPPAVADGSELTVRFLDVGQADAALLSCDGEHMLIDGGNKGDSRLIYRTLEQLGIRWLTLVVGTHAHEDHIGGLPGALSFAEAGQVLCPVTDYDSEAFRDFARLAELKGGGLIVP
ncbi:MAG: MBL fold metallo-hydrolase, partial [Clostridia bacterium]|nr:MBL fold metallo-hydrolase [Clostridia bacterium]